MRSLWTLIVVASCSLCAPGATSAQSDDDWADVAPLVSIPQRAQGGVHPPRDQGQTWADAQQIYLYARTPGLEARVRVEVGSQGARAWVSDTSSKQARITWHTWRRGALQHAHVSVHLDAPEGPRHAQAHVALLEGAKQVHHAHRKGPLFVHPMGLQWRCPPGAVRLCRKAVLPQSYATEVPVEVVLLELGEARSKASARRQARAAWARDPRLKGVPFGQRANGKRAWGKLARVGQRWVLCGGASHRPLTSKQRALWRARSLSLCDALRATPERLTRQVCRAPGDACVRACGHGDGAACRLLASAPGRTRQARAQYLTLGCQHADALACVSEQGGAGRGRACALGHAPACLDPKDTAKNMRACRLGSARGCARAARRSPLRALLLERACRLGDWSSCGG